MSPISQFYDMIWHKNSLKLSLKTNTVVELCAYVSEVKQMLRITNGKFKLK